MAVDTEAWEDADAVVPCEHVSAGGSLLDEFGLFVDEECAFEWCVEVCAESPWVSCEWETCDVVAVAVGHADGWGRVEESDDEPAVVVVCVCGVADGELSDA